MSDICSTWSYDEIRKSGYIGDKQAQVLRIFVGAPDRKFTATQIVKIMGRGVSENVRNRITELEQMGFLKKDGVIQCQSTMRMVNLFKWSGRRTPLPWREEWVCCDHCQGKGKLMKKVYYQPTEDYTRKDLFS